MHRDFAVKALRVPECPAAGTSEVSKSGIHVPVHVIYFVMSVENNYHERSYIVYAHNKS